MFTEKFRIGEQTFDARHLRLDRVDLRFDAFEFAGFFERQFARLRCFYCGPAATGGECRRFFSFVRGHDGGALPGRRRPGFFLLFQIIIVIADAVMNLAVAFKREDVRADAV